MKTGDFPTEADVYTLANSLFSPGKMCKCEKEKLRREAAHMLGVLFEEVQSSWKELNGAGM